MVSPVPRCRLAVAAALLCSVRLCGAAELPALPAYHPSRSCHGVIRSWGHGFLRPMMKLWEDGFQRYQPGVRFDNRLVTSAAAIAGLYTERIDLGVLAREILPSEAAAYEKMTHQKLTAVTVLMGSYGNQDKIMTLGIFVNRDNPLAQLTFGQLDAIWGSELRRGEPKVIRRWDQLGLDGGWRGQTIHPYSGLAFEAPGAFFAQRVMGGSVLWNDALRQFENTESELPSRGDEATAPQITRTVDAYQKVVDAVGSDRLGIGLAGAGYRNPRAKLAALATSASGPFVAATPETIVRQTYPLARPVKFYINRGAAIPADPNVIEFLRFVLSREGQALVAREGDFLPLDPALAQTEQHTLS